MKEAYCIGNGQVCQFSMIDVVRSLNCMHDQQAIMEEDENNMKRIRRLTPRECERLMGFPDDYTNIGAWTDSKGKLHKESSDTSRYKALGNSICLPFWFVLLRKISAKYDDIPTMGSLFDGIGGFPYCWARINGLNSVLWASEIEEFPIAVTTKHFGENGDFYQILEKHNNNNSYKGKWDKPNRGDNNED